MVVFSNTNSWCWIRLLRVSWTARRSVNPKGNQSWIFIGRTDMEAETPILWPPDVNNWLIGKDPDAAKDWRQKEKEMTEDEVIGWHHRLDGHEFEQALGVGDGQGSMACCSPWGCNEADTTEWLNDKNDVSSTPTPPWLFPSLHNLSALNRLGFVRGDGFGFFSSYLSESSVSIAKARRNWTWVFLFFSYIISSFRTPTFL